MTTRRRRTAVKAPAPSVQSLRLALELEHAARQTTESYCRARAAAILELEEAVAIFKARAAGLEQEVQGLRNNPVQVPRQREKLPASRPWTEAWSLRIGDIVSGTSCVVHLSGFSDGRLGEVFLRFGKKERGSHGAAMADLAVTYLSILLQYLHPLADVDQRRYNEELDAILMKMIGAVDDSGGWTRSRAICDDGSEKWSADPDVHRCSSLRDYLGKKLRARFCAPPPVLTETATNPEDITS